MSLIITLISTIFCYIVLRFIGGEAIANFVLGIGIIIMIICFITTLLSKKKDSRDDGIDFNFTVEHWRDGELISSEKHNTHEDM